MAQLNFNASEVTPDTGSGDPLPEGWYNVMIDESDIKPTKDAAVTGGAFLSVRFNVIDGQFQGRKLFSRFNIRNQNPTAQEIGYRQLSAVAHAVGVLMVQDSQQLHGIPLKVRVKIRPGNLKDANNPNGEKYDPSNDITSYKNINEVVAQPAAAAPIQGFAAPAAAAPGGFAGFAQPAQQFAPAPAAPNPAQWAAQPAPAQQFAPAAPQQQFAPAPQQFAPAPAVQQFAQPAPVQQFAAPEQQAPAPQFAAPQQPWAQPAPAAQAPQFAAPQAPAQAPQFAAPQVQQAPQQFAQPAPMQAPAAAPAPQAPAVAAAQSSAPPWARPAA